VACDRIARLIAALDAEDADATLDELEACGEAALPALLEVVRDAARGDDARALAAVAIGHVTDAGPAALVPLLGDVDEDVADLAAFALRWPPPSWVAEPVLLEMLSGGVPPAPGAPRAAVHRRRPHGGRASADRGRGRGRPGPGGARRRAGRPRPSRGVSAPRPVVGFR
jgi:hypothetical protein